MTVRVMDHHPVAAEFPADQRAGCINCTSNAFSCRVFPHERAAFTPLTLFLRGRVTVSILTLNMGKEEFILYSVPAVKIAAGKLALDFYKLPKTRTAFPTPVTLECYHTVDWMLAGGVIKSAGTFPAHGFAYRVPGPAQIANKFDFSDFSEKYKYAKDSTIF
jgi:hypothetical protein